MPSRNAAVASVQPTTAGIPSSRAIIAAWHVRPPRLVTIALARFEAHFDPLGQHLRFYTRDSLATTLDRSGFQDVRVRAWGGLPPLRTGLMAWARRP